MGKGGRLSGVSGHGGCAVDGDGRRVEGLVEVEERER